MSTPRRPPSIIESFNYAFEGIIHVLRTQRNMRIHFGVAALVLIAALASGVDKLELIALLLAIAFVLIAEMINTAVEAADRRRDDVVRPDGEAREGHRGRRRPDRDRRRGRGRLPRLLGPGRRPELAAARPALADAPAELTLIALVADDDHRHRNEGVHRTRDAAARRPSVGPRGGRVRRAGWR